MTQSEKPASDAPQTRGKSKSRLLGGFVLVLVILAIGVAVAPLIVAKTERRNAILAGSFPGWKGRIESQRATFWWLSPIRFENVRIYDEEQRQVVAVAAIELDKTLLEYLNRGDELGGVRFVQPEFNLTIDENGDANLAGLAGGKPGQPRSALSLEIVDGLLTVGGVGDSPLTEIRPLNLNATIGADAGGKQVLTIDEGRLIDKMPVTREVADMGLKYVAPVLANAAWADGRLSLDLSRCVVPLDSPEQADVSGQLTIHSIEAGARNPVIVELVGVAGMLLNRQTPPQVRLADESVVDFWVENERVRHRNLKFGLPEVSSEFVIATEGSVGFDQTLDLQATIPLPLAQLKQFADLPIAGALKDQQVRLTVAGTFAQPRIGLAEGGADGVTAQGLLQSLLESDERAGDIVKALEQLRDVGEAASKGDRESLEDVARKGALSIGARLLEQAQKRRESQPDDNAKDQDEEKPAEKPDEGEVEKPRKKGILRGLLRGLQDP